MMKKQSSLPTEAQIKMVEIEIGILEDAIQQARELMKTGNVDKALNVLREAVSIVKGRMMKDEEEWRMSAETDKLNARIRELEIAILMCAASCQGGHSNAGEKVANTFGIKFPLTMESLARVARKKGLDPDKLWPWWKKTRGKTFSAQSGNV